MLTDLLIIFITHFIADFIFQTRNMANNKSKSVKWLTIHVLTYVVISSIIWLVITTDYKILLMFMGVTFTTHWLTDFITSKLTSYFYLKSNEKMFFTTIGFDQCIHSLTLLITYFKLFDYV